MSVKKPIDDEFHQAMAAKVQEARKAIDVVDTVKRLGKHVRGELHLTKEQIRSAEILLKKAMPDLRELQVSGEVDHKHSLEDLVLESMRPAQGGVTPTLHQKVEH